MKNAVIDDSKQLSNIEDKKAKKRAKQRERAKNQDYVQSRKYYFKKKYLADRQWNLKKKYQSKLNKLFHDNDESEKSKALIGCTIPELKELLQTKLLSGMSLENYGTVWFFRIPFSDYDLTIEEEVKRCLHYSRIEPMYNDTKEVVTCSSNDKTDLSD